MDNDINQRENTVQPIIVSAASKKRNFFGIKLALVVAVILIIGALVYTYKGLFIAATVNGYPITRFTVVKELEKASGKQALDSLIVEMLINSEAQKKGITVSADDINAEIKTIEDQLKTQNQTLDQALQAQQMTLEDLRKRIDVQKKIEKLVADKIQVTDEEITKYITDNKFTIPAGQEETYKNQIKDMLKQQKLSTEATSLVDTLKSQAKIHYFVNY